jgi:hypothetical protein
MVGHVVRRCSDRYEVEEEIWESSTLVFHRFRYGRFRHSCADLLNEQLVSLGFDWQEQEEIVVLRGDGD